MNITLGQKIICAIIGILLILSLIGCASQTQQALDAMKYANAVLVDVAAQQKEAPTPAVIFQAAGVDPNVIPQIIAEYEKSKTQAKDIVESAKDNPVATYSLLANVILGYFAARKKK